MWLNLVKQCGHVTGTKDVEVGSVILYIADMISLVPTTLLQKVQRTGNSHRSSEFQNQLNSENLLPSQISSKVSLVTLV